MSNYDYITDVDSLSRVITKLISTSNPIGFDIETTGLDYFFKTLLLCQLNIDGNIFIVDVRKLGREKFSYLISMIKDGGRKIIGHNLKFDLGFIFYNTGEILHNLFDTQVAESLAYAGLKDSYYPSYAKLVKKYLDIELEKETRNSFIDFVGTEFTEKQLEYSSDDVNYLPQLYATLSNTLAEQRQANVSDLEMSLTSVFMFMENTGVLLDQDAWKRNTEKNRNELLSRKHAIVEYYLSNIDFSRFNNAYELSQYLKVDVKTKKLQKELEGIAIEFCTEWFKDNVNMESKPQNLAMIRHFGISVPNTNEKTLEPYKDQDIVRLLLEYREVSKLFSTYGDNVINLVNPITKRIHSKFNQTGAATGRISSEEPNMQNLPRSSLFRSPHISRDGFSILTADYSQAELRLMGAVSKEPEIIKSFINNEDLHKRTASFLFHKDINDVTKDERQTGKTLNFGTIYLISPYGLQKNFGIPLDIGEQYLADFFANYKYLNLFIKVAGEEILNRMYSVTPFGRRRYFEDKKLFVDYKERNSYFSRVRREGINHIIQGGIADAVKIAMRDLSYNCPFKDGFYMLLQVHDELVFEVKDELLDDAKTFVVDTMVNSLQPFLGEIPAIVDISIGKCWGKD